jgi:hypothetical protein
MTIGKRSPIEVPLPVRLMLTAVLAMALAGVATLLVFAWASSDTHIGTGRSAFNFLIVGWPLILGAKAGWSQTETTALTFAIYFLLSCVAVWGVFRKL